MADPIALPPPYDQVPMLRQLANQGAECDQLLAEAIRRASRNEDWNDAEVVVELAILGHRRLFGVHVDAHFRDVPHENEIGVFRALSNGRRTQRLTGRHYDSLQYRDIPAHFLLAEQPGTTTADHFLRSIIAHTLRNADSFPARPFTADLLLLLHGASEDTPLSGVPAIKKLIHTLSELAVRPDDVEFILALDASGRIRFRSTGHLGDYAQDAGSGLWVPARAMLVHHRTFGSFTLEQIAELEDLINDPRAGEARFQAFFERHPHFFRRWDHRAVHPHVYLTREEDGDGPLIPDFILTNAEAQQAFLLDLKLPGEKVFRSQKNRERFSGAIMEARAQLLEYRDWFDDKHHREKLKDKVGMAIYRPQLSVIIGRSSEFRDGLNRQKLRDRHPDLDVVTYDDLLGYARKRLITLDGGPPGPDKA